MQHCVPTGEAVEENLGLGSLPLRCLVVAGMLWALVACTAAPAGSPSATPGAGYDRVAAAEQARTFNTIATTDAYGNYGEQFSRFCEVSFGFDCNRADRDIGDGISSAQEIQIWEAEKNNPQSVVADIGILFIPQAEAVGILADYEPAAAAALPDDLHGPGWVATFVGVPTMLINVDVLESRNLPIPEAWADLTDQMYRGMVGLGRVGISGSATWAFVAMNLAAGGTLQDWQPGIEYGRALLPNITQQASIDTFARGEVPISVRYDFNQAPWFAELDEQGVRYRMQVPTDGSVYSPSTLMLNRYDEAHADFGRMFMDWVLTDEAQIIFARYGARPIRSVTGTSRLVVPEDARSNWLPDEAYANVETVNWQEIDSEALLATWENDVVGGG
jgi:putative spermidine/putrescine transport system substrate-binding protein